MELINSAPTLGRRCRLWCRWGGGGGGLVCRPRHRSAIVTVTPGPHRTRPGACWPAPLQAVLTGLNGPGRVQTVANKAGAALTGAVKTGLNTPGHCLQPTAADSPDIDQWRDTVVRAGVNRPSPRRPYLTVSQVTGGACVKQV